MVAAVRRRAVRVTVLAMTAMLLACDPGAPLAARTDEPMLYVVLVVDAPFPTQEGVVAVVANTGTPPAFDYRPATRLELRRRSDAASFAWRPVPEPSPVFIRGNYEMLESASAAGLGWRDLVPGERYDLEVETQGRLVTGSTLIPDRPLLRLRRGVGVDSVIWNRASGAAAYRFQDRGLTTDTLFVVDAIPSDQVYYVTAYDEHLANYLRDATVQRAGISGAFGLLGSQVSASITIPAATPVRR